MEGSELSVYTNPDDDPSNIIGDWTEIVFDSPCDVEKDITYAIVTLCPEAPQQPNFQYVGVNVFDNTSTNRMYLRGDHWTSANGGSGWARNSIPSQSIYRDALFQEYGSVPASNPYPEYRPPAYDEDLIWDEDSQTWKAINAVEPSTLGGGRYGQQLVVLSNQGKIYVGDL